MTRLVRSLLIVSVVFAARPALAQGSAGSGKVDLSIVAGGWVAFAKPETQPEPAFGEYLVGAVITFTPGPVSIEGALIAGLRRSQELKYGTTSTVTQKSPPVFFDEVNLVVPLMGNNRSVVPFVTVGITETTINRTRDVGQLDTETFLTSNVGGGVKWYSSGRWGIRVDYRYLIIRSEAQAPGTFFGKEQRKAQRFSGGLVLKLINR